jgi:hypothetical protein
VALIVVAISARTTTTTTTLSVRMRGPPAEHLTPWEPESARLHRT